MNTKHTPAPWSYKNNCVIGDNATEVVAQVFGFDTKEKKANAKLIAAAPDLLEALQLMVSRFENSHIGYIKSDYAKAKAKSAIKKATT